MDNSFILLWKLIKVWTHGVDNGGVQGEGHTIGATEYIHCRVGTQPHVYKKNVSHARGGGVEKQFNYREEPPFQNNLGKHDALHQGRIIK